MDPESGHPGPTGDLLLEALRDDLASYRGLWRDWVARTEHVDDVEQADGMSTAGRLEGGPHTCLAAHGCPKHPVFGVPWALGPMFPKCCTALHLLCTVMYIKALLVCLRPACRVTLTAVASRFRPGDA